MFVSSTVCQNIEKKKKIKKERRKEKKRNEKREIQEKGEGMCITYIFAKKMNCGASIQKQEWVFKAALRKEITHSGFIWGSGKYHYKA